MSYESTELLLPMNGANGGTSFPDLSRHAISVGVGGNAQTSTAQSKYYGSSGYFDGSSRLSVDPGIRLGSGDFTISLYARFTTFASTQYALVQRNTGSDSPAFGVITSSAKIRFLLGNTTSTYICDITGSTSLSVDTWYHIEFVRSGSNFYGFIDGTQDATTTSATTSTHRQDERLRIANDGGSGDSTLYINDLRIIKGTALHTTTFTPPTKLLGTLSNQGVGGEAVKDDAGNPAARTIIAVPRNYTAGLSRDFRTTSDGSGLFSLTVPSAGEFSDIGSYAVLALDDAAGTVYNDLVHVPSSTT